MGIYNEDDLKHELPPKLRENICPFCDHGMNPFQNDEIRHQDAFHYKCDNCNPTAIIGMSRNVLSGNSYNTIESEPLIRRHLREKIGACQEFECEITTEDFPKEEPQNL